MIGVIDRCPSTISLIARGATPMARAMAFWEIPHRIEVFLKKDFAGCYVASGLVDYGFHGARIR
jgi:hypothetical protein